MRMEVEHKARVRKHFDCWAERYDSGHITRWFRAFQQRVIDVMSPQVSDNTLDVGCGTGWAVLQLGLMLTRGRSCGIDLAPAMIERAKAKAAGLQNVEFKLGDAENIPYGSDRFDALMCSSSFHHYPNPVKALREFRRVLKAGGKAYLLDTYRDQSPLIFLYDLGHKILVRDHVRYYHSNEIKDFFERAGFSEINVEFRTRKFFLYGKFLTSVMLISARKG